MKDKASRRRVLAQSAALLLITLLLSIPAYAGDKYWIGADGAWNDGTMWNPAGQPQNGDTVYIAFGSSQPINRTINYANTLYPNAVLNSLSLRALGNTSLNFVMSFPHTLTTNGTDLTERVVFDHIDGTHVINGRLYLEGTDTPGTYNLMGGSLYAEWISLAPGGRGVFNQSGGTCTTGGISVQSGSSGIAEFNLNGGNLVVNDSIVITNGAKGTFTQTAGTLNAGRIQVGGYEGVATYNLKGGTISATSIGVRDRFIQTGGDVVISDTLGISGNTWKDNPLGPGVFYTLSKGTLSAKDITITGIASKTTLGQASGTTITVNNILNVGGPNGSFSTSGTLTAKSVTIGDNLGGTFTQAGQNSTVTISDTLYIRDNPYGYPGVKMGIYNMQGGTLNANKIDSPGELNFSGGTINTTLATLQGNTNLSGTGTRLITGEINNSGTFNTTNTTAEYRGKFTNNGTYQSTNSTQYFTDLVLGSTGVIKADATSKFFLTNSFLSTSTMSQTWDTSAAYIGFTGTKSSHQFSVTGLDVGALMDGFISNFAWDGLTIGDQGILTLLDGNTTSGGALYLEDLLGASISGDDILNIFGNGLNIYYLVSSPDNAYLGGLTYDLMNGGQLIPIGAAEAVPEPGTILLFTLGAAGLLGAGWVRRRREN